MKHLRGRITNFLMSQVIWTTLILGPVPLLLSCTTTTSSLPVADQLDQKMGIEKIESLVEEGSGVTATSKPVISEISPFPVQDRMVVSTKPPRNTSSHIPDPLFTFRAQGLTLNEALVLFARANELNIVAGPDLQGTVTVDFKGLPLERAMEALLDAHGYYWEEQDGLIRVHRLETRIFTIDYIRLVRGGTGRNKAQVTSGSGGGQDAGEVTLEQQDSIKFWEELEGQLKVLLSQEGRLVVNRMSGTIHVTDVRKRVKEIAKFLASVRRTLYRQVEIEARIYEITLRDDYSLGIDWNQISFDTGINGIQGLLTLANAVTSPAGGFTARPPTANLTFQDGSFQGVITALSEQGDVRVVSQPRILTLNNQPALIKVGTDQSFFTSTVSQGAGGTGNIVTETVRTVTSGLVLSVTPQISEDGWIMMDVTPIITRLTDTVTSINGSTAPVLDVKQTGGLVRMRDGEMMIIGGLIQDQTSETERKVPLLGDLPFLGRLFKGTYSATAKTELVIFLSPRIVRS